MTLELGGKELFFIVMVGDVTSKVLGEDFIRHFDVTSISVHMYLSFI